MRFIPALEANTFKFWERVIIITVVSVHHLQVTIALGEQENHICIVSYQACGNHIVRLGQIQRGNVVVTSGGKHFFHEFLSL